MAFHEWVRLNGHETTLLRVEIEYPRSALQIGRDRLLAFEIVGYSLHLR